MDNISTSQQQKLFQSIATPSTSFSDEFTSATQSNSRHVLLQHQAVVATYSDLIQDILRLLLPKG